MNDETDRDPIWAQTGQWTYEFKADGVLLGRVVRNGLNVLAYGAGNEHLGYWSTVEAAKGAVEGWVSRRLERERLL